MGLKISGRQGETIYFSNGVYVEHTRAYYEFRTNTLTVITPRFLPRVLKLLEARISPDDTGKREIIIRWWAK